ncbi:hypothetical protein CFP56_029487 [Quercus suber]|uniref:Uncharacterized protein n=1 Tax=Quercus suber TaxID=58331 RepID=A0AAW0JSV4_QUESU
MSNMGHLLIKLLFKFWKRNSQEERFKIGGTLLFSVTFELKIKVAPAPIIYPLKKPSNSPRLEPIAEEGAEEYNYDS